MALERFDFNPSLVESFINLQFQLYSEDPNWIPPIRDSIKSDLVPSNPYLSHARLQHFMLFSGKTPISRASAFLDEDLKDKEGRLIGLIGLFESENDKYAATAVLDAAMDWLRTQGATQVLAPVSFSIWHSYRLRTKGHQATPYYGEPYNPYYYPDFFTQNAFAPTREYGISTLGRQDILAVIEKNRADYEESLQKGYSYRNLDHSNFDAELGLLYELLVPSFRRFPGWTDISHDEFVHIYQGMRRIYDPRLIIIALSPDGEPAAVVIGLPDMAQPIRELKGRMTLFGKARYLWRKQSIRRICISSLLVLKEHRGQRLSNALAYLSNQRAFELGYTEAIHGPSALDNLSTRLHGGDLLGRRYTLYQRAI